MWSTFLEWMMKMIPLVTQLISFSLLHKLLSLSWITGIYTYQITHVQLLPYSQHAICSGRSGHTPQLAQKFVCYRAQDRIKPKYQHFFFPQKDTETVKKSNQARCAVYTTYCASLQYFYMYIYNNCEGFELHDQFVITNTI